MQAIQQPRMRRKVLMDATQRAIQKAVLERRAQEPITMTQPNTATPATASSATVALDRREALELVVKQNVGETYHGIRSIVERDFGYRGYADSTISTTKKRLGMVTPRVRRKKKKPTMAKPGPVGTKTPRTQERILGAAALSNAVRQLLEVMRRDNVASMAIGVDGHVSYRKEHKLTLEA